MLYNPNITSHSLATYVAIGFNSIPKHLVLYCYILLYIAKYTTMYICVQIYSTTVFCRPFGVADKHSI